MPKYFYDYEDLERKWLESNRSDTFSNEKPQTGDNIEKNPTKSAKTADLLKKERECRREMEKIARFRYFYGGNLPEEFRGMTDEQIANKLDDLKPKQPYSRGAYGMSYEDSPYTTKTIMKRTNPNVAFKERKKKKSHEQLSVMLDDIVEEYGWKKGLDGE